jgi:hypothetical protein
MNKADEDGTGLEIYGVGLGFRYLKALSLPGDGPPLTGGQK